MMFKKISLNLTQRINRVPRNLKFFLGAFFLSLPFWWNFNVWEKNMEDFFFKLEPVGSPSLLTAQITSFEKIAESAPVRVWKIENLKINARAAISVFVEQNGKQKVIFEKERNEKLPIASVTKLMTAYVASKIYDSSEPVKISLEAVNVVKEEGANGNFKTGDVTTVEALIHSLLIESSNDAAEALTQTVGREAFIDLMNKHASSTMKMQNTFFVNPTGLDPDTLGGNINLSTAEDLARLISYLAENNPEILRISASPEYDLYTIDNTFHHKAINTDGLLGEIPGILASKTGWTPQAQGCLVLMIPAPNKKGLLINVVLGSPDRFTEMKKLIDWLNQAYQWE